MAEAHTHFTPPELANFLAAQAVAAARSFLEGRSESDQLSREAMRIFLELQMVGQDTRANAIADPTRLLIVTMMRTASATGARAERWAAIMDAFVALLRDESVELAKSGAQRR